MKEPIPSPFPLCGKRPIIQLPPAFAGLFCITLASSVMADTISLVGSDAFEISSFNSGTNWSDSAPPSPDNHYLTGAFTLRTPAEAGDFVFAGSTLTVGPGGRLLAKGGGSNTTQTITIPSLFLNGGAFDQAMTFSATGVMLAVNGSITVSAPSSIGALGGGGNFETMDLFATLGGSSPLTVAGTSNNGDNGGVVRLHSANPFNGVITVAQPGVIASETHRLLQLGHPDALRHATLELTTTTENAVSFAATANTDRFRITSLRGTASQTLVDTAGEPVILEIGGEAGADSEFQGRLRGSGSLVKTGWGTLAFNGPQPNTYSGDTTIVDGTVSLHHPSLHDQSTVSISWGGRLELLHNEVDVIAALIVEGIPQPPGTYHSSTHGNFLSGSGRLKVDPDSEPPDPEPEEVTLTQNDGFGASSLNSAGHWSNGAPPSAANRYLTGAFTLRTPTSGNVVFGGHSLVVETGGRLLGKATPADAQIIGIDSLILDGGRLEQADGPGSTAVLVVEGNIDVRSESTLGAIGFAANGVPGNDPPTPFNTLEIRSAISGTAPLTVAGTANNNENTGLVILSSANPYEGVLSLRQPGVTGSVPEGFISSATGRLLQLNHPDALRNATLELLTNQADGLSFSSTANTGAFKIGALAGTGAQTLADTEGAAVAIDIGGNDAGTTFSGPLSGPGSLVKSGSGTLTLSAANTYTGSTTVAGGTLVLEQPSLADGATVRVAEGAVLHLPHGEADAVGALFLAGVPQEPGIYDSNHPSGLITGSGGLEVLSGGGPGFTGFMASFENLTDAERAAGADPDGDGISNLLEYALDGLDPTAPDTLPSLQDGGVSFTKRGLAVDNGDVSYIIETSATLGAEPHPWTSVTPAEDTATTISYTFPTGSPRNFVRLRVVLAED